MKHRVTDIHDYFEKYRPFARTLFPLRSTLRTAVCRTTGLNFLAIEERFEETRGVITYAATQSSSIRRPKTIWNSTKIFRANVKSETSIRREFSTWIKMAFRFHSKVLINVKRNRVKKSLFFFFSTRSIANHGIFLSNIEQVSAAVVRTWWWAINSKPINKDVSSRNRNATRTYIPIRIIDYDEGGSLTLQNTKKWITRIRN